jgi:hypothetical protein
MFRGVTLDDESALLDRVLQFEGLTRVDRAVLRVKRWVRGQRNGAVIALARVPREVLEAVREVRNALIETVQPGGVNIAWARAREVGAAIGLNLLAIDAEALLTSQYALEGGQPLQTGEDYLQEEAEGIGHFLSACNSLRVHRVRTDPPSLIVELEARQPVKLRVRITTRDGGRPEAPAEMRAGGHYVANLGNIEPSMIESIELRSEE